MNTTLSICPRTFLPPSSANPNPCQAFSKTAIDCRFAYFLENRQNQTHSNTMKPAARPTWSSLLAGAISKTAIDCRFAYFLENRQNHTHSNTMKTIFRLLVFLILASAAGHLRGQASALYRNNAAITQGYLDRVFQQNLKEIRSAEALLRTNGVWLKLPPEPLTLSAVSIASNFVVCEVLAPDPETWELHHHQFLLLTNYSNPALATGEPVSVLARRIGRADIGNEVAPVFDCGFIKPRPLTVEEITAARDASEKRRAELAAKALHYNESLAAKGDAFGLLRMGERYRDGDGVEKNPLKARELFERAAAQGNQSAIAALKNLPPGP